MFLKGRSIIWLMVYGSLTKSWKFRFFFCWRFSCHHHFRHWSQFGTDFSEMYKGLIFMAVWQQVIGFSNRANIFDCDGGTYIYLDFKKRSLSNFSSILNKVIMQLCFILIIFFSSACIIQNESSISQTSYRTMVSTTCFQLFKTQTIYGGRVVENNNNNKKKRRKKKTKNKKKKKTKNEMHGDVPVSNMWYAFRAL